MDEPCVDCTEVLARLYPYLDRELTAQDEIEVAEHLSQCPSCWDHVEFEEHIKVRLRGCCNDEAPLNLRLRILRLR